MNAKSQQVIINLRVAPKGFIVIESTVDAPTLISFPKNVIYGNNPLPYRPTRGRIPNQRTLQALSQELAQKKTNQGPPHNNYAIQEKYVSQQKQQQVGHDKKNDQGLNGKIALAQTDFERRRKQEQHQKVSENRVFQMSIQKIPLIQQTPLDNIQEQQVQTQTKSLQTNKEQFLKQFDHFLPATTRWFSLKKIHQIEKDALPEFFPEYYLTPEGHYSQAFKNPTLYLSYRNDIIERYLKSPRSHLKILECLQYLQGDISAIIRIFTFLEHWGIINYNLPQQSISTQGNYYQLNKNYWERFKVNFNQDVPQGLVKNVIMKCQFCMKQCDKYYQQSQESFVAFQNKLLILCQECINQKLYPSCIKIEDFEERQTEPQKAEKWTQEVTLRLLELVLKCQENWHEIKKHFSSHSIEEIIKHYLHLPFMQISDISFIDEVDQQASSVSDATVSFAADNSNPIMLYISTFKISLDQLQRVCNSRDTKIEDCKQQPDELSKTQRMEQMIHTQISKVDETLSFLEEFEKNISAERLVLNDYERNNNQLSLERELIEIMKDC